MPKAARDLFDPKLFLAKVGEGKTILKFERNKVVFAQGDIADTVFYIQKGEDQSLSRLGAGQGSRGRNPGAWTVLW
jgi:CRP-like cAMP-binding protein